MTLRKDIHSLAESIGWARPDVDGADQSIIRSTYRLLGQGRPVSDRDIARSTGLGVEEVSSRIARWPGVYRDDAGAVIGFWGLTVAEMPPHEILLEGRRLWAWCAWDTLFLPHRLEAELDARSVCPTTGEAISLRVAPTGVQAVEPAGVVVSFLEPSRPFDADVIGSFCHYVHFFADEEAGGRWTSDHPGTFLLSLEQAFELGRLTEGDQVEDARG